MSKIDFRSVTKLYRDRRVVDALSLVIESGERVVLFGPSGCGKSTTLLLVAGLVAPDSGEIRIDGKVVSSARKILIPPQSRGVGMVFQDLALWPHMSVAENIAFGLRARRVPAVECDRRIRRHRKPCRAWRLFERQAGRTFRAESNSVSRWHERSRWSRAFC